MPASSQATITHPGWAGYWTFVVERGYQGSALLLEQRLEVGIHPVCDDAVAGGGGMDAVALVQPGVGGHAVQQERHEGDARPLAELSEDGRELARVDRTVIRRYPHAGQQHAQAGRLEAIQDGREV